MQDGMIDVNVYRSMMKCQVVMIKNKCIAIPMEYLPIQMGCHMSILSKYSGFQRKESKTKCAEYTTTDLLVKIPESK
jgi:hypothetical protein